MHQQVPGAAFWLLFVANCPCITRPAIFLGGWGRGAVTPTGAWGHTLISLQGRWLLQTICGAGLSLQMHIFYSFLACLLYSPGWSC